MANPPVSADHFNDWGLGQEVRSIDLDAFGETAQDLVGYLAAVLAGQTTLNGALYPLTITKSGANVTLAPTAGSSTSPIWLCQGRLVDEMAAPIVETPPGATLGRIDIFQAKPAARHVNPFTVLFWPGPNSGTAYQNALDADITYKQGVDSGTPSAPSPDAGYVAVATVTMPAGGGNPTAVAIVIPSFGGTISDGSLIGVFSQGGQSAFSSGTTKTVNFAKNFANTNYRTTVTNLTSAARGLAVTTKAVDHMVVTCESSSSDNFDWEATGA